MSNHTELYRRAELYDVAFDFRDIAAECDFLEAVCRRVLGRSPANVLELAAGPARHLLEFARRGVRVTGVDLSPAMVRYGRALAAEAKVPIRYRCGDMVEFSLGERFDLAMLLMDSASYLLDNGAVLAHLASVADHLTDGGVYILEISHPRDMFGVGRSTRAEWERERDGIHLRIRWGCEDDPFDPVRQVRRVTTRIEYAGRGHSGSFTDRAEQRLFTANEFQALVAASGRFRIVEIFGALDTAVPFDNRPSSWRMVPVLQKFPAAEAAV